MAGLAQTRSDCKEESDIDLLPWGVIGNITAEYAAKWPVVEIADLDGETVYDTPVMLSEELFTMSLRSGAAWDDSEYTRAVYGYAMYGYFSIIFFLAMIGRGVEWIRERRRYFRKTGTASQTSLARTVSCVLKQYITVPSTFGRRVARPYKWFTVPQRLQTITIAAWIILNVVLCCVSYEVFDGNLYWNTKEAQIWRYLSDRTGVLALSNMPLMFAFAMRNNVLLWLTGWDFATFNMFHRWVARVSTLEAVIHSIGYTMDAFLNGGQAEYIEEWSERFWWMGAIATIVMCLLCATSILPIRRHWYEIFLIVHIGFGALFLVGMWYHVEIFDGEYAPFIWPCAAVWTFDRLLRLSRVCYLNLSRGKAMATYNPSSDVIRVRVPVRPGFHPKAGTHYYLYGLNSWKPWESHPFTLSTWETKETNVEGKQVLSFIIRPYDSFTARLRKKLVAGQGEKPAIPIHLRCAVEGPYGHYHDLRSYNSIIFVIGGSGITVALSYLQSIREALYVSRHPALHSIRLVWAVRDGALFEDVYQHELVSWLNARSLMIKQGDFQVDLYVTGTAGKDLSKHSDARMITDTGSGSDSDLDTPLASPITTEIKALEANIKEVAVPETIDDKSPVSPSSSSSSSPSSSPPTPTTPITPITPYMPHTYSPPSSRVTMQFHRPIIHDIVLDTVEKSCVRGERLAVVTCGPGGLADDTRAAVVAAYSKGYEGVDLVIESFGW